MNKMEDITQNNKRFEILKAKWKRLGFFFISVLIISFFMKIKILYPNYPADSV